MSLLRYFSILALLVFSADPVAAAEPLFAKPLHLTREVRDSLTNKAIVIDEYCFANQVVSIHGEKVSIADYAKGELTQIDHGSGTYSITTFEQIAAGNAMSTFKTSDARASWSQKALASRGVANRTAEVIELAVERLGSKERIELALDPQTTLSRSGFEVLTGAAYPNRRTSQHDALLKAARRGPASGSSRSTVVPSEEFALPLQQVSEFESDGEILRSESRVLQVNSDLPPTSALVLPATRVESPLLERQRLLQELDRLPSARK